MDGKFFLFAAFFLEAEQKPLSGRIIVFDLQVHGGADPGESVGKDPKQSAIAQAGVRGCVDHVQKLLNFTFAIWKPDEGKAMGKLLQSD